MVDIAASPAQALAPANAHHSAESASPASRIQLLNSFRCDYNGVRLKLPHSTARVLALLCLHVRPVPRSHLCQLLWPQASPELASGSLRTAVWRLRRACPGLIAADDHELVLHSGLSVDYRDLVDSVEQLRRTGDPGVKDAVEVFSREDDLLPGWYDDWVILHRERLRELRWEALRTTARSLEAAGHLVRALDLAMQALATEPLDEDSHTLVVRIHLTQGNAAEALRHFHLYETLLRDELDLAPSEAMRALVQSTAEPMARPASPLRPLSHPPSRAPSRPPPGPSQMRPIGGRRWA
jgi:DNA-binding SARP family transcriptional activator